MSKNLAELTVGQRGVIRDVDGEPDLIQRLMELGLTDGEEVELVRFAPLGDPLEIRIRGYLLSLRRHEARAVLLEDRT
jgi:ferrous iron transport protein A